MASTKTLIKGRQIKISDFIKGLADVNWSSDILTASAAAIAAKIENEIAGVAGAMLYRGEWSEAATDTIKKGYVYVYGGNSNGSIGSGSSAVTLESGDLLIANKDNASIADPRHWTIVNMNLTGALTDANFVDWLLDNVMSPTPEIKNIVKLERDDDSGKLKLTYAFPTITNGQEVQDQYISGISIEPNIGKITVTRRSLENHAAALVLDEICEGECNGRNRIFKTKQKYDPRYHHALFINGVKQTEEAETHADYVFNIDDEGHGVFTLLDESYIPVEEDFVTCIYFAIR